MVEHCCSGVFTVKPPKKGHIGDRPVVPCRGCPLLGGFLLNLLEISLKDKK